MAKLEQSELKCMPKRDPIGKAAKIYLDACRDIVLAKEEADEASTALVKIMRLKKRKDIRIEGVIITLQRMEAQDKLKVKKPKS